VEHLFKTALLFTLRKLYRRLRLALVLLFMSRFR
jgi:hypothetical protein